LEQQEHGGDEQAAIDLVSARDLPLGQDFTEGFLLWQTT